MPSIPEIVEHMPQRYRPGVITEPRSYYFSLGEHRYTVRMTPEACEVDHGRTVDAADCVLKATEDLFRAMVLEGKMPGPLDIARGRIRTNDPLKLADLLKLFDFTR